MTTNQKQIGTKYYAEHREERLAYQKARYALKAEQLKAYQKAYRASHREQERVRSRSYKQVNKERLNAKSREWRAKHPHKHRALNAAFRHSPRGRAWYLDKDARRRAQKLSTQVGPVDLQQILKDSNGLCGICKKPFDLFGIDFDHIVPLARGGTHTADNIQATHSRCNRAKGARVG